MRATARWVPMPLDGPAGLALALGAAAGLGLGTWPWLGDIDAWQGLRQALEGLQGPRPATSAPDRSGGTPPDPQPSPAAGPGARWADDLWQDLQQGLQAHGLQLQALRPGPVETGVSGSTRTLDLEVLGRWADWRAFERTLDRQAPGWTVNRWQVTPVGVGPGQVRLQWQLRWDGQAKGAPLPGLQAAHGHSGRARPLPMASPLFGEPPPAPSLAPATEAATPSGPARQWPVQALRLQGFWQQSGARHAVLGQGLEQVVVAPGQVVGREAYRVLRVGADEVVLAPPGGGMTTLRLGGRGGEP